jgi:hypothetical protein
MSNIQPVNNFPNQEDFKAIVEYFDSRVKSWQEPLTRLLMLSGASMNWLGDFFTDPNVSWSKRDLKIDGLWLTGTNPELNRFVIEQAERSPAKLRQILSTDPAAQKAFGNLDVEPGPILVREEEGKLKVLFGIYKVLGMIRAREDHVSVYLARVQGEAQPQCEPHVVYDLLRAYQRKSSADREGLVAALRFLRRSYSNVDDLLQNRFGPGWVPDEDVQKIIQEALKD